MHDKLKIGILLKGYYIPNWQYQMLATIKNSDYSEIVVVILASSFPAHEKKISGQCRILKFIDKADSAIFKTRPDYKQRKDASGLFPDVRKLQISSGNDSSGLSFTADEISDIRKINLDIILKLGFQNLNGDIVNVPKYGVWGYSVDIPGDGGLPEKGFLEVVEKVPVTNSVLGIVTEDPARMKTIFSGWESTCQYSVNVNRHNLSWRTALFAPRIMKGISEFGEDYWDAQKARFVDEKQGIESTVGKTFSADAIDILFSYIGGVAKSIFKKLVFTDAFRWQLLFQINKGASGPSDTYGSFRKLLSPEGIFWADPFVVAGDDFYWIFVEEFIYKKDRAHLSVLKLDKEGNFIDSRKIIERPYHMSYPFVFRIGDSYYMIPETSKNRTIELYKCIEFPYKWEFERNIMENVSAVDSTLFNYNDKWWLFTAMDQTANISGSSAELFLFYTDDIFSGTWKSHRLNPIVSDIRNARPAGKIFFHNGEIYRPSQNCAGRYGIAFNLNHITKLTENEYEEAMVAEVKPAWDKKLKGTHTLNFDNGFTVIDAYSFRNRLSK